MISKNTRGERRWEGYSWPRRGEQAESLHRWYYGPLKKDRTTMKSDQWQTVWQRVRDRLRRAINNPKLSFNGAETAGLANARAANEIVINWNACRTKITVIWKIGVTGSEKMDREVPLKQLQRFRGFSTFPNSRASEKPSRVRSFCFLSQQQRVHNYKLRTEIYCGLQKISLECLLNVRSFKWL